MLILSPTKNVRKRTRLTERGEERKITNLPIKFAKGTLYKAISLIPFLRISLMHPMMKKQYKDTIRKVTDPSKVYLISTDRVVRATCAIKPQDKSLERKKLRGNEESNKKNRGKVFEGDWDMMTINFMDLPIHRAIKQTIEKDEELRSTDFFKLILEKAKSSTNFWSKTNSRNLRRICEYFDSLKIDPSRKASNHRQHIQFRRSYYDAIDVNIGRNGEYFFQNNAYFLSIAKALGVKSVPVRIFVRHKQWQELREFVLNSLHPELNVFTYQPISYLYQPIVHPDFADFPLSPNNTCRETMKKIESHLSRKNGTMLDIGANTGFFCHKFEDLGYKCYAVENNMVNFRILEKIKRAEKKEFVAINKSIFEIDFVKTMKFDVILALNIFHHFLKTKTLYDNFKELLRNLETDLMFFSTANYKEEQMRNAYQNYSDRRFIEFIFQQTGLNKSEVIFTNKNNRNIYKLSHLK